MSFALCRLVWDRQWMSKPKSFAHSLDSERSQVASLIGLVLEVTCTSNEWFHFISFQTCVCVCDWRIRTKTLETTEWIISFHVISIHFTHVVDVPGHKRLKQQQGGSWICAAPAFFRFRAVLVPYREQNCCTQHFYLRLTLLQNANDSNDQSDPLNPVDLDYDYPDISWSSRSKEPGAVAHLPLLAHLPCPETSDMLQICLSKVCVARCCNKLKPWSPELIGQRWLRSGISSIYHNLPVETKAM